MADRYSERGDEGDTAGQRADPVATKNADLAQAGGPLAGDPAKGGSAYASEGRDNRGSLDTSPDRSRTPDVPASNTVAPRAVASQDRELRDTEAKARKNTQP